MKKIEDKNSINNATVKEFVSAKKLTSTRLFMSLILIAITLSILSFVYESAPIKKFIIDEQSVPSSLISDPESQMILSDKPILIYYKISHGNGVKMTGASCNMRHLVYHFSWTAKKVSLQKIRYYKMLGKIKIWMVREENHLIIPVHN